MEKLEWTGERFLPEIEGDVQIEHMHRYALALKFVKGKRVLDIACGEGYGTNLIASGGAASVLGVDISETAVRHAQETYNRDNLDFVQGDCSAIPAAAASFDVVVSFETIEHHDRHDEFMSEIKRVLVPGGLLIISSPDKKEYSDLPRHDNQYHVKELYLSEFEAVLNAHFSRHVLLGQRIKYGSLVVPLDSDLGVDFISQKRDHKGFFHEEKSLFDPMYFLALASDGDIPEVFYSIYEHPVETSEIVVRVSGQLDASEEKFRQVSKNHEALQTAYTEQQNDYATLGNEHSALREKYDQMAVELERRENAIKDMLNSSSWRMTRPIRYAKRRAAQWMQISRRFWGALTSNWFGFLWLKKMRAGIRAIGGFKQFLLKSCDIVKYRDMERLKNAIARHTGGAGSRPKSNQTGEDRRGSAAPALFTELFQVSEKDDEYVELRPHAPVDTDIRLIAFYLPQFHPIKENDETWGKGFTEWTNVSKAKPQYLGHYQPKLPGELGFYDLRLDEIHRRQIELAKNYGIHGFCYHYYWFNGKKVLDLPIRRIMANPDMDLPFCINWANENWTKRWDGLENEIILKQNHSPEDDLAFIRDIEPLLKDKRYIRVDGKPLLMVYRPSLFPDVEQTASVWRDYCRECGLGEIYLVISHAHEHIDPSAIGFDAASEFAPNTFAVRDVSAKHQFLNQKFQGQIYDYCDAVNYSMQMKKPRYQKFRSLCPGWDNESRKPGKGIVFHGSLPEKYSTWLDYLLHDAQRARKGNDKLVFINAWNEWAEGAYLEPDRRFGYAYLERTYQCLKRFGRSRQALLTHTQNIKKDSDIAVVLHLHYLELWDEICKNLDSFSNIDFDLYLSVNPDANEEDIKKFLQRFPRARIFSFENRGRDILPFLHLFTYIYPLNYKYVCKIHSKKSVHRKDGDRWRNELIRGLIGSPQQVRSNLNVLAQEAQTGILVSKGNILNYQDWIGSNDNMIRAYAKKNHIDFNVDFQFPSGSMFWFKPIVLRQLYDTMDPRWFEVENGQLDGTMAHSIERLFGLLCRANGYALKAVS